MILKFKPYAPYVLGVKLDYECAVMEYGAPSEADDEAIAKWERENGFVE